MPIKPKISQAEMERLKEKLEEHLFLRNVHDGPITNFEIGDIALMGTCPAENLMMLMDGITPLTSIPVVIVGKGVMANEHLGHLVTSYSVAMPNEKIFSHIEPKHLFKVDEWPIDDLLADIPQSEYHTYYTALADDLEILNGHRTKLKACSANGVIEQKTF